MFRVKPKPILTYTHLDPMNCDSKYIIFVENYASDDFVHKMSTFVFRLLDFDRIATVVGGPTVLLV